MSRQTILFLLSGIVVRRFGGGRNSSGSLAIFASRHQPQRDIHQHFQPAEVVSFLNNGQALAYTYYEVEPGAAQGRAGTAPRESARDREGPDQGRPCDRRWHASDPGPEGRCRVWLRTSSKLALPPTAAMHTPETGQTATWQQGHATSSLSSKQTFVNAIGTSVEGQNYGLRLGETNGLVSTPARLFLSKQVSRRPRAAVLPSSGTRSVPPSRRRLPPWPHACTRLPPTTPTSAEDPK